VVTGAADGYYRMSDRPASTLLHLGPGLANGLANLHNAKKARSGVGRRRGRARERAPVAATRR
jgi:acetolactate synthase-1/2/3 large subunit